MVDYAVVMSLYAWLLGALILLACLAGPPLSGVVLLGFLFGAPAAFTLWLSIGVINELLDYLQR